MNRTAPVIIIEDDDDDQHLFAEAFKSLGYPNPIKFFIDGIEALEYLNESDIIPFLIISDINLPKLDGFKLRDKIKMDAKLQLRCIPYLFFSTALDQNAVVNAYSLSVQGFFVKQNSVAELEHTVKAIMEYWLRCA
jgi:CheY-like chemotaxis protein